MHTFCTIICCILNPEHLSQYKVRPATLDMEAGHKRKQAEKQINEKVDIWPYLKVMQSVAFSGTIKNKK